MNAGNGSGRQLRSAEGMAMCCARPTQQLLEEMMQNSDAPLPRSFQKWVGAPPFVPPEDEEWHVISGFHVRISRAELDELLAQAEASESEDGDIDSLADTSVGGSSVRDDESEREDDLEASRAEMET
eukprot:TRINITY_DN63040_c0_g1_i1.p1 TRINITY_DN63040_c0_g1~~TRINITY_DN63040_c0_g1_i1.p1  ORF type:complete len:127 (+),score=23.88 TRINITY_DN63040_c0_g1_i1:291-671(+)